MVGGAVERAANGEKVLDAKAAATDAAAGAIGTLAEKGVSKLIGPASQMKIIEKTASKTIEAFKTSAELAAENLTRNSARQGITAALNTAVDAARREQQRKEEEGKKNEERTNSCRDTGSNCAGRQRTHKSQPN